MLLKITHIDFICQVVRSIILSGRIKASVIREIPIWVYKYKRDSQFSIGTLNMRIRGDAEVLTCINNRKKKLGGKSIYIKINAIKMN